MSIYSNDVYYCTGEGEKEKNKHNWYSAAKWYWKAIWSFYKAENPQFVVGYYEESCSNYEFCFQKLNLWQKIKLYIWKKHEKYDLKNT